MEDEENYDQGSQQEMGEISEDDEDVEMEEGESEAEEDNEDFIRIPGREADARMVVCSSIFGD